MPVWTKCLCSDVAETSTHKGEVAPTAPRGISCTQTSWSLSPKELKTLRTEAMHHGDPMGHGNPQVGALISKTHMHKVLGLHSKRQKRRALQPWLGWRVYPSH